MNEIIAFNWSLHQSLLLWKFFNYYHMSGLDVLWVVCRASPGCHTEFSSPENFQKWLNHALKYVFCIVCIPVISTSPKENECQKMQGRTSSEKARKATSACGPRKGCVGLHSNLNPYSELESLRHVILKVHLRMKWGGVIILYNNFALCSP